MQITRKRTSDGLGEEENPSISILLGEDKPFIKLTHEDSSEIHSDLERIYTYKISIDEDIPDLTLKTHFFWMSGYQFDLATQKYPSIINRYHAAGPGITASHIRKRLGEKGSLEIFLTMKIGWGFIQGKFFNQCEADTIRFLFFPFEMIL